MILTQHHIGHSEFLMGFIVTARDDAANGFAFDSFWTEF
jgi:hypothetical protein